MSKMDSSSASRLARLQVRPSKGAAAKKEPSFTPTLVPAFLKKSVSSSLKSSTHKQQQQQQQRRSVSQTMISKDIITTKTQQKQKQGKRKARSVTSTSVASATSGASSKISLSSHPTASPLKKKKHIRFSSIRFNDDNNNNNDDDDDDINHLSSTDSDNQQLTRKEEEDDDDDDDSDVVHDGNDQRYIPILLEDKSRNILHHNQLCDDTVTVKIEQKDDHDSEENLRGGTQTKIDEPSGLLLSQLSALPLESPARVLCNRNEDQQISTSRKSFPEPSFLFQLPSHLPSVSSLTQNFIPDDQHKLPQEKKPFGSKLGKLFDDAGINSLQHCQEGYIGKLQIYQSGKVKLLINDILFDIEEGIQPSCHEELVSLDATCVPPTAAQLGDISHSLLCSLAVEQLEQTGR